MKIGVSIIGTAAAVLIIACSGPDAPPADTAVVVVEGEVETELVEYLFVQHADRVSLENGVLTLEGVGNDVLYFSDRPDRIVGRESLSEFIDDWDEGEESFATIPPNAIVTVVREGESLDLAVVLKDPTMLGEQLMTYNVEVLDGPDSGVGDDAAIFIDAFGLEPGGKRGVETRLGKPGHPGDPGGLRDADIDRGDVDFDRDVEVQGKRGRDGSRQFQRKNGNLDRKF